MSREGGGVRRKEGPREEGDFSSGRAIGTAPLWWVFSAFESRKEAGAGEPAAEGSLLAPGVKKAGPRGRGPQEAVLGMRADPEGSGKPVPASPALWLLGGVGGAGRPVHRHSRQWWSDEWRAGEA